MTQLSFVFVCLFKQHMHPIGSQMEWLPPLYGADLLKLTFSPQMRGFSTHLLHAFLFMYLLNFIQGVSGCCYRMTVYGWTPFCPLSGAFHVCQNAICCHKVLISLGSICDLSVLHSGKRFTTK